MLIKHFSKASQHLLFWSLITVAVTLTVVRVLLTQVNSYKAELEQQIQQAVQLPIHIGKLDTNMRGFSPGLILQDIHIDNDHAPMQLQEVRIGIDLLQLLLTRDPLAASWVTLVGLNIDVIRNADGKISIKGIPSSDEQPTWLMQGSKYEILQSQIHWQDFQNNGKSIAFDRIDLVLKNHYLDGSHELHAVTHLPEQYGDSLRISANVTGNIFEPASLQGQLYIEANNLQGPELAIDKLPQGLSLASGSGDLKIWSHWQNAQLDQLAGYFQAQQIKLDNPQGKSLRLDTIHGNISWLNQNGHWRLGVYDLDIFASHRHWTNAEFYLAQQSNGDWSALIKQFDLNALSYIAPWFIGEHSQYADFSQLNPSGKLQEVKLFANSDWQHYALQGQFDNLGINPSNGMASLQGLSGQINGNQSQGQIAFNSENIEINALDVFRNKLFVPVLNGKIHWQQDSEHWQLSSDQLALDSADFKTNSRFQLSLPKNHSSANLQLLTRFGEFHDMSQVPQYLPAKIMSADAVAWLDDAFVAGQINEGELVVNGNLDQFPFSHGEGRFETLFTITNGELQFNEDWPHLQDLYATVDFLAENLLVSIHEGRSENVGIKHAIVGINDLANSSEVLVHGELQSQVNNALLYLQKGPLHGNVDSLVKMAKSEGNAQISLDLKLPYEENDPVRAKVDAHLNNARMTLKSVNLPIDNINGTLTFTEDSVSSKGLNAKTLGYPIQAEMKGDSNNSHLLISGNTTYGNLQKQFNFLPIDMGQGSFNYQADLLIPSANDKASILTINSNLQGLNIIGNDLLAKTAEQQQALQLVFQFDHQNLLPLAAQYGTNLHAALLIDSQKTSLYSGHIVIGGNPANSIYQSGLKVEIKQPSFKLAQAISAFNNTESNWPKLREVLLDTDQVIWQGQNLGALQCHFQHSNQSWHGIINSEMAKGRINLPDQLGGSDQIRLEMDSINLSAMTSLDLDAAEQAISELPLIEIDSQQVLWRNVNLGKLKLQTERLINGIHFKKIKLSGAGKNIDLTAHWIKQLNGTSTQINGNLSMNGFGQFLSNLGFSDDFKETHAELNFNGGWLGAPHQFSLAKLNGVLQVKLSDGRISSIEPGFGRLLGLLAMEQWVKRLSLDFSDIYRQGLAFDAITGSLKINNGMAYTDNLLVDAVSAKMKVIGSANLIDKTLDNRIAVIPKSSDALPIAGTIVGGIAAVVTEVITNDYQEGYFFGSEYKVTGQWGNLEVTPTRDRDGILNKTWHGPTDFNWLK